MVLFLYNMEKYVDSDAQICAKISYFGEKISYGPFWFRPIKSEAPLVIRKRPHCVSQRSKRILRRFHVSFIQPRQGWPRKKGYNLTLHVTFVLSLYLYAFKIEIFAKRFLSLSHSPSSFIHRDDDDLLSPRFGFICKMTREKIAGNKFCTISLFPEEHKFRPDIARLKSFLDLLFSQRKLCI